MILGAESAGREKSAGRCGALRRYLENYGESCAILEAWSVSALCLMKDAEP